jgi:hypothetical protein
VPLSMNTRMAQMLAPGPPRPGSGYPLAPDPGLWISRCVGPDTSILGWAGRER